MFLIIGWVERTETDLSGGGEELVDEVHVADHVLLIGDNAEKVAELVGFGGVGLDGGEDGTEVGEGDALLAQLLSASVGGDGGVGHVAAQGAEDVAQVEGVDIVALVGLVEDDESVLSLRHFGGLLWWFLQGCKKRRDESPRK